MWSCGAPKGAPFSFGVNATQARYMRRRRVTILSLLRFFIIVIPDNLHHHYAQHLMNRNEITKLVILLANNYIKDI